MVAQVTSPARAYVTSPSLLATGGEIAADPSQCATAVVVHGYVATADIEVQVNGASVPIVNGAFHSRTA